MATKIARLKSVLLDIIAKIVYLCTPVYERTRSPEIQARRAHEFRGSTKNKQIADLQFFGTQLDEGLK
jgi:hypothetical protein